MFRLCAIMAAGFGLFAAAPAAMAGAPDHEERVLGSSVVRIYLHDFLAAEELATLRVVQTNAQALAIFLPAADLSKTDPSKADPSKADPSKASAAEGHAALALAPDEGLLRDGQLMASAAAIGGLGSAAAAESAALAACDAARKVNSPCVIVLTVAPKG